jgi:hypothetical protein
VVTVLDFWSISSLDIAWGGWGKPWKPSLGIASLWAEIWTRNLWIQRSDNHCTVLSTNSPSFYAHVHKHKDYWSIMRTFSHCCHSLKFIYPQVYVFHSVYGILWATICRPLIFSKYSHTNIRSKSALANFSNQWTLRIPARPPSNHGTLVTARKVQYGFMLMLYAYAFLFHFPINATTTT